MSLGPAAFIGLGAIGAPMAARLARGARLTVGNRSRARAEEFARAHGVSETLVPERVLTGAWPRTFRLALLHKDVGIARELLRDTGVDGPLLGLTGELFDRARGTLGESADHVEAIRLIEAQAGVQIRG